MGTFGPLAKSMSFNREKMRLSIESNQLHDTKVTGRTLQEFRNYCSDCNNGTFRYGGQAIATKDSSPPLHARLYRAEIDMAWSTLAGGRCIRRSRPWHHADPGLHNCQATESSEGYGYYSTKSSYWVCSYLYHGHDMIPIYKAGKS
jgi:hypothetical protein